MTNDERRNEIQGLADKHQQLLHQMADLGREIQSAGYRMTPDYQSRLARLMEAEKQARAEYDIASAGWHETIYVKPFR